MNLLMRKLDYMVITDSFQRKGLGSKLLQYCIDSAQSRGFLGLLLEIQLENVDDSDEQKIRKDRIRFYKKFGAKTFENVEYYIPPQSGDTAERMHLMIIPVNELDSFPKKTVENLVRKMHLEIYHSKRMDLIEKTVQSLTENIKLIGHTFYESMMLELIQLDMLTGISDYFTAHGAIIAVILALVGIAFRVKC